MNLLRLTDHFTWYFYCEEITSLLGYYFYSVTMLFRPNGDWVAAVDGSFYREV